MEVYGFRQLVVWQVGMELNVEVYRLVRKLPPSERFGLADQLRRASTSITANIAEGSGRDHLGEYLRFLSIARGSLMELDNHLELSERLGYLNRNDLTRAVALLSRVRRLLSGLTHSLRSPEPETRHPKPPTE